MWFSVGGNEFCEGCGRLQSPSGKSCAIEMNFELLCLTFDVAGAVQVAPRIRAVLIRRFGGARLHWAASGCGIELKNKNTQVAALQGWPNNYLFVVISTLRAKSAKYRRNLPGDSPPNQNNRRNRTSASWGLSPPPKKPRHRRPSIRQHGGCAQATRRHTRGGKGSERRAERRQNRTDVRC